MFIYNHASETSILTFRWATCCWLNREGGRTQPLQPGREHSINITANKNG